MSTIVDGNKRIPYMRGMLMHYLIERGFDHDDAFAVANAVRESLGKTAEIKRAPLLALVAETIRNLGQDPPPGELVFWERLPTAIAVGGQPFSSERLAHSLQASGLEPGSALQLANAIQTRLLDLRRTRIKSASLEKITAEMLTERHGKAYAQRYRVWRLHSDQNRPLILLIGGASGVGKTSLAVRLASVLDIPRVVATDDIRQIMRLTLSPDLLPAIHSSSYAPIGNAPRIDPSQEAEIAGYREQTQIIGVGVRAIIERCLEENTSVIIDGVHLHPDFIDTAPYMPQAMVVQIALAISDIDAYKARFTRRSRQAPARPSRRYLNHLPQILRIQDHFLEACNRHNIPVIDTATTEDATFEAVMTVVEQLSSDKDIRRQLDGLPAKKHKKR